MGTEDLSHEAQARAVRTVIERDRRYLSGPQVRQLQEAERTLLGLHQLRQKVEESARAEETEESDPADLVAELIVDLLRLPRS